MSERQEAEWIIGTDGANSTIRKDLGLSFEGSTWNKQIVATNVYYPFGKSYGWTDSNFIIDRENWYMAAKITTDGMWRVTYGETIGLTCDEILARQETKFKKLVRL